MSSRLSAMPAVIIPPISDAYPLQWHLAAPPIKRWSLFLHSPESGLALWSALTNRVWWKLCSVTSESGLRGHCGLCCSLLDQGLRPSCCEDSQSNPLEAERPLEAEPNGLADSQHQQPVSWMRPSWAPNPRWVVRWLQPQKWPRQDQQMNLPAYPSPNCWLNTLVVTLSQ